MYALYILWEEDSPYYKIGVSTNTAERKKTLQAGNPHKLRLIVTVEIEDRIEAYRIESGAHRKWEKYRVREGGEWFILEHKDVAAVERFLKSEVRDVLLKLTPTDCMETTVSRHYRNRRKC